MRCRYLLSIVFIVFFLLGFTSANPLDPADGDFFTRAAQVLKADVLKRANWAMKQSPLTVTASYSPRSSGGKHDFFSEGDYWWPDPKHPDSPYVQKDGMSNPDNFVEHRRAMVRLSSITGALASAYLITKNTAYAKQALRHTRAWFIDPATKMNPHLLYAQAIKGRFTGRGIGIIDTIHFMETVQALLVFQRHGLISKKELLGYQAWFGAYLKWLTTHPYGITEMQAKNNHGTCWTMQVAQFAKFTGNDSMVQACKKRFMEIHLPDQMAADGSFPKELARTKPYGYSLFNLDAMAMICQILSGDDDILWNFTLKDGRSIRKGIDYMHPFVKDKSLWPFAKDVMYWDDWPVAHPFLVFGAQNFGDQLLFETWKHLPHVSEQEEVLRNLPVRNPLIWL